MPEALRSLSNEPLQTSDAVNGATEHPSRDRLGSLLGQSPVERICHLRRHVEPTGPAHPGVAAASGSSR